MRCSKSWVSVTFLTISLTVVLGLSMCSLALAQEARWRALYNQTMELYQQGKYREAVPVAKEALKVAEQTFAPDHPNVDTNLNNLAMLYVGQGKYAEAEPLHKRALAWVCGIGVRGDPALPPFTDKVPPQAEP